MSKGKRYPQEFKVEAVKQVTNRGYSVMEVARRLDISTKTLYHWVANLGAQSPRKQDQVNEQAEVARLKSELKRVTEERDILKKAAVGSTGQRNTLCQFSGRRHKAKRFAWARIQFQRDSIEIPLRILG